MNVGERLRLIEHKKNRGLANAKLIKAIQERYDNYQISDQFKDNLERNSDLFAGLNDVIGMLRMEHTLTFNNLNDNIEENAEIEKPLSYYINNHINPLIKIKKRNG